MSGHQSLTPHLLVENSAASADLRLVAGTAEQLPFADGVFGLVIMMLAPHAVPEISRVLWPGGCTIL